MDFATVPLSLEDSPSDNPSLLDVFAGACLLVQILAELQSHGRRLAALERLDGARERSRAADTSPRRPVGRPRGSRNKPQPQPNGRAEPAAAPPAPPNPENRPKLSWHRDLTAEF
jgi:hypothetical protein